MQSLDLDYLGPVWFGGLSIQKWWGTNRMKTSAHCRDNVRPKAIAHEPRRPWLRSEVPDKLTYDLGRFIAYYFDPVKPPRQTA